jgi:hypothetical protein
MFGGLQFVVTFRTDPAQVFLLSIVKKSRYSDKRSDEIVGSVALVSDADQTVTHCGKITYTQLHACVIVR